MTVRTGFYKRMVESPYLQQVLGGADDPRIFAKKSMTSAIEDHPFIVYKFGNNTAEQLSETEDAARQFVQVFIHDHSDGESADYMLIDSVIARLKATFYLWNSPEDGIIAVQYLETSQDLNDETLNTVMKYVRFQLITKEKHS